MSGEGEFSAIYASVESGGGEQECYELDKVKSQQRLFLPPAPYLTPKPGSKGRRKPPGSPHQLERKYTTLRKTNRTADSEYASVSRSSKSSLKSTTPSSHKLSTLMEEGDIDEENVPPTNLKAVHILLLVALVASFVSTVMAVYTLASFESQRREHSMDIYSNCVKNVTTESCPTSPGSCSTDRVLLDEEVH